MFPKRARQSARLAGFVAITTALLPLYLAADAAAREEDRDDVRDIWTRRWSRALLRLFSIDRKIEGISSPSTRGRLVVANHRSTIDIGILLDIFGGRMVSRADLASWPVIGIAARKTGTVFVDRSKKSSGASVIRVMVAFVAAARAHAEIVPVGITYDRGSDAAFIDEPFLAHLARLAGAAPSRVRVVIGDATLAEGDPRVLAVAAHDQVQTLVNRGRASFQSSDANPLKPS